ncbi:MAG: rhodanese-like domain-containing protein [Candidatus Margulisiibacteriota bacterium]
MKKIFISLFIFSLLVSAAFAHPATGVKEAYDGVGQELTLFIYHKTNDPTTHYIEEVSVRKTGVKDPFFYQRFNQQLDNEKQVVKLMAPNLEGIRKIEVQAKCNKGNVVDKTIAVTAPGYTDVSPAQVQVLMEKIADLVILDVSPKYAEGHLPGAVSIPLEQLKERVKKLSDKSKTYLVYCHADGPSIAGAKLLAANGFSKVYRLKGNYAAWVAKGYKAEK